MEEELRQIGRALGYKKIERVISAAEDKNFEVGSEILRHSIRDNYAILFINSTTIQISPYGFNLSVAFPKGSIENNITKHPKLDEKFLRTVFTGFELILYKTCCIVFTHSLATERNL
jgi:hypothetical protein